MEVKIDPLSDIIEGLSLEIDGSMRYLLCLDLQELLMRLLFAFSTDMETTSGCMVNS